MNYDLKVELAVMDQRKIAKREAVRCALKASSVPMPDDLIRALCLMNPKDAHDVLRDHPGHACHEAMASYEASRRLFECAVQDLFDAIQTFDEAAQDMGLFDRTREAELKAIELRVQKEVYAAASAAHALVDHTSRRLHRKIPIERYEEHLEAHFLEDGLNEFVLDLRNVMNHVYMLSPGWWIQHQSADSRRVIGGFKLERDKLMLVERWSAEARNFLHGAADDVDLSALFGDYRNRVEAFHEWFGQAIRENAPPELRDYERCLRELRIAAERQSWRFLLGIFRSRNEPVDPYDHLHRYLTADQLGEVLKLPHRSREQVDRIIECVDEHQACDDEIREEVYRLFQVQ